MKRLTCPAIARGLLVTSVALYSLAASDANCAPAAKSPAKKVTQSKKPPTSKAKGAGSVAARSTPAATPPPAPAKSEQAVSMDILNSPNFNGEPTFVKADSLTLKTDARTFKYAGSVEVKHGDMTITSDSLEGNYDENNKIQRMLAHSNVVILKGDNMRGTATDATYTAAKDTVVLTGSPELTQNESTLSADVITIFLKDNRSEASGQVRVKLVNKATPTPVK
ncbi:MAG: hypothetical protein K1X79_08785 [Oligoflexia bacterium]|nr:hypothetical protein [Oligoflexia bacterium]